MPLSSIPGDSSLIKQGNQLKQSGQTKKAIALYHQAIAIYPALRGHIFIVGRGHNGIFIMLAMLGFISYLKKHHLKSKK